MPDNEDFVKIKRDILELVTENRIYRDGRPNPIPGYPEVAVSVSSSGERIGLWFMYDGQPFHARVSSDLRLEYQPMMGGGGVVGLTSSRTALQLLLDMGALFYRDMGNASFDPNIWWDTWSSFMGNAARQEQLTSVFAELLTISLLLYRGERDVYWGGPQAAPYDIAANSGRYEVKSSRVFGNRAIHVHNRAQMSPGINIALFILDVCGAGAQTLTLQDVLQKIEEKDARLVETIRATLDEKGIDGPQFDLPYAVYEASRYVVTDKWPKLPEEAFPSSISVDTYRLDLQAANLKPDENLLDELQSVYGMA